MEIRKAEKEDIKGILALLSEVLEIHADIRPDIFIHGTTKYTEKDLLELLCDDSRPVYVCVGDNGNVCGYAFCVFGETKGNNAMYDNKSLYIDDLCVSSDCRGMGIGKKIFNFVKSEAKKYGCDDITLAVWNGNENAVSFYKKMGMSVRKSIMELKI